MLNANAIARELAIVVEDLIDDLAGWELTTGELVVGATDVEPGEQHFVIHVGEQSFIVHVEEYQASALKPGEKPRLTNPTVQVKG